jgi:hypothetical protein
MQRTLLENVLNCFQLTTLAIMILLVDSPHLKIQEDLNKIIFKYIFFKNNYTSRYFQKMKNTR